MKKVVGFLAFTLLLTACSNSQAPQATQTATEQSGADTRSREDLIVYADGKPVGYAEPIAPDELDRAFNDPNYGPALVAMGDGVWVPNEAYKRKEAEDAKALEEALAAQAQELGSQENALGPQPMCFYWDNCTVSTQWAYRGFSRGRKLTHHVTVANRYDHPQQVTRTVEDYAEFNLTGGFDARSIRAELGVVAGKRLSTTVHITIPPRSEVSIYKFQTGTGGYGTQYRYPRKFASCWQAGSECKKSNFQVFAGQGIGIQYGQ